MHELSNQYNKEAQTATRDGSGFFGAQSWASGFFGKPAAHGGGGAASRSRKQVGLCCEVMALFQRGVLILDEVDLILHPLRAELNWPLGERKPLDFTSERHAAGMRWELPLHLLDPFHFTARGECVMCVPRSRTSEQLLQRIAAAVARGCSRRAMTMRPHLQLLDPQFYERELRPLLARWLLLLLLKLGVKQIDEEEMLGWLEHGRSPPEVKASALKRHVWQVKLPRHFLDTSSTLPRHFLVHKRHVWQVKLLNMSHLSVTCPRHVRDMSETWPR